MCEFNLAAYEAMNEILLAYPVFCSALESEDEDAPGLAEEMLDEPYTDAIFVGDAVFLLRFRIQTEKRDFTFTRNYGVRSEWDCTVMDRREGHECTFPAPCEINGYLENLFGDDGYGYLSSFGELKDAVRA